MCRFALAAEKSLLRGPVELIPGGHAVTIAPRCELRRGAMDIHSMLDARRIILELKGHSKHDALLEIIDLIGKGEGVTDANALKKAILDREEIMSTGVGLTIAVPHAKLPSVKQFSLGLARSTKGIAYDSLDGKPVHVILMIAAPDNDQNTYLRVLAAAMHVLRNEGNRKAILAAKGAEEIIGVFKKAAE
jgi:mannitol/fructose-specific phosphotransferase system IIA component (Ntr-type)